MLVPSGKPINEMMFFALLMAVKKLAPALATGCTIVLKPAEQTPISMALFAQLTVEAGIPPGVINYVTGLGESAGAAIASHGGIAKVTFTGSVATGKSIVRSAADDLKRVSLELGGKPPNIVFDDADLDEVVAGAAAGAFATQGESCIAGSRLYVQRGVFDEVFGPVVCAVPFDTENEVLALANNTRFGLGAAVWTRDISRAHRMAAAIESGQVWVNCYQAADSALPFGGTKESGWGRETCRETLEEYLETKTVVVSL
jgi:acyl-CoA reductase-like NAD-dependent aldehyde dehydrogenase